MSIIILANYNHNDAFQLDFNYILQTIQQDRSYQACVDKALKYLTFYYDAIIN